MEFYKIKHKPSGLFYQPIAYTKVDNKFVKTNFTKKGKTYATHLSLKIIGETFYLNGDLMTFNADEFEIVEFDAVEVTD